MMVEDQSDVIAFLESAAGGLGPTETSITTHISRVFLKADRALKLKQAVRFPYVDFSSVALRVAACHAEVDLNRRTAPNLYVGVRKITREKSGELAFDGNGRLVDVVVEMRRFSENDLLDTMAQHGALSPIIVTELARRIAAFHAAAAISTAHGGAAAMADVLDINDRSLRATTLVERGKADAFANAFRRQLAMYAGLLDARRAAGKVRRCHGDLILRNICMIDGVPTPFDCIEFSEPLATIDVLYDLGFLLMDLWHRDQAYLASILFNRYLDSRDETDGLPLAPFFMGVRAAVRAHVMAAQAMEMPVALSVGAFTEARAYLDLASSLLEPRKTRLLAFGGFSGSGKSTLAANVAHEIGSPPGARVLNSDRIRKSLHGARAEERLPDAAYRPDVSRQVYARLFADTARTLSTGASVIADGVFDRPDDRAEIEAVAIRAGVPFHGFWLEAPKETLTSRIANRVMDPSDATAEVLAAQLRRDTGQIGWNRISAQGGKAAITDVVLSAIGLGR
jgi:uncharacterized protein